MSVNTKKDWLMMKEGRAYLADHGAWRRISMDLYQRLNKEGDMPGEPDSVEKIVAEG